MTLKDRAATARQAQNFKKPEPSVQPQPTTPKPRPSQKKKPTSKPTNRRKTANQIAREKADVDPQPKISRLERQANRRETIAQLVVELSPDQKAQLITAAAENGRTIKDEVLYRLQLHED